MDSEDGWSTGRVINGAPKLNKSGTTATYLQHKYQRDYAYLAETQYAEGEFTGRCSGQKSSNVDYANGGKQSTLALETANNEHLDPWPTRVGRHGGQGFRGGQAQDRSQVSPLSGSGFSWGTILLLLFVLLFILPLLKACIFSPSCDPRTDPDCSYSRSSSGSYGGYTSGGSHK